jgi:hypothetical protein
MEAAGMIHPIPTVAPVAVTRRPTSRRRYGLGQAVPMPGDPTPESYAPAWMSTETLTQAIQNSVENAFGVPITADQANQITNAAVQSTQQACGQFVGTQYCQDQMNQTAQAVTLAVQQSNQQQAGFPANLFGQNTGNTLAWLAAGAVGLIVILELVK